MTQSLGQAKRNFDTVFRAVTDTGLQVARSTGNFARQAVGSRRVQKAVIGTTLLAIAGTLLYIPAVLGYLFFYYKFLPELETTVPVHLQYGVGPNPFGIASLERIVSRQPYDIAVSLTLPRSPANLDRGNFMIALHLLAPVPLSSSSSSSTTKTKTNPPLPYLPPARTPAPDDDANDASTLIDTLLQPTRINLPAYLTAHTILYTSTRPALIPYADPIASLASRVLFLFYHMLFPRTTTTVHLTVPMVEALAFQQRARSSSSSGGRDAFVVVAPLLPGSLLLEVQAGQGIQVYQASVTVVARLRGLRGFMYRWRATAFVLFTAGFWVGTMVVGAGAVLVVGRNLNLDFDGGLEESESGENEDEVGEERGGGGKRAGLKGKQRLVKSETPHSSSSASLPAAGEREEGVVKKEDGVVKKEEEDELEMGMSRVPEVDVGQSTEADDEAEDEEGQGKVAKGKEVERV
ncbi:putative adipose-regulatory protein-domain-containing protein [Chaetomidium leptoderma]|uniref:Adipose-regulatory protein-domain-containing protein n=1 Tax=Chaetomidium leptoderma TaxID=669021 RepID=A0AAN6VV54_9PEZI|nr:putative adipose-regulatory protein-domain-containing protein [Chaetomidium leptoderma]